MRASDLSRGLWRMVAPLPILLLVGCDRREVLPQALAGNFTLHVTNQSTVEPVDILALIDGKVAVEGSFLSKGGHEVESYTFAIEPGKHILKAKSTKGKADYTIEFVTDKRNWAVLSFDYYQESNMGRFHLTVHSAPVYFL